MPHSQESIAQEIIDSITALLAVREEIGAGGFADKDKDYGSNQTPGLLASMHGIRTIFNALIALDSNTALKGIVRQAMPSLLGEWRRVLDQIQEKGYIVDPYDPDKDFGNLFSNNKGVICYTDTISWALSTAILVNRALTNIRGLLPNQHDSDEMRTLISDTRACIATTARLLIEGQCEDGGWSWKPNASAGHLFYTWSVIQGYADYYDYIAGESATQIGIARDDEMCVYLDAAVTNFAATINDSRIRATAFLARKYLPSALGGGVTLEAVTNDDIAVNILDMRVLAYCDLFLFESLILSGYDVIEDRQVSERRKRELETLYQMITGKMDRLFDADFADETKKSTFSFIISGPPVGRGGKISTYEVADGGLWPQLLRTLILYRFYLTEDAAPDPRIIGEQPNSALNIMLDARCPVDAASTDTLAPGLWDTESFNLPITTRCIEGLVDCHDYFDCLADRQKNIPPHDLAVPTDELATVLGRALYPQIEEQLRGRLPEQLGQDILETLRPHISELVQQQVVEQIRSTVNASLKASRTSADQIRDGMCAFLNDSLSSSWWGKKEFSLTTDELIIRLLGSDQVSRLIEGNPQAHRFLSMLTWLIVQIGARMGCLVLQELILNQLTPDEITNFRNKDGDQNTVTLLERLEMGMKGIADKEIADLDVNVDERIDYRHIIKAIIDQQHSNV